MKPEIIAEIAQAHDGSLGFAHSFIDLAADCGADTVKFQVHFAEEESRYDEPWRVKFTYKDETRFEYWKRMEFTPEEWAQLKSHCDTRNVEFLCSPFSLKAVNLLEQLKVKKYKIASGEVTNTPMLEAIKQTGKPVIISSGMSDFEELEQTMNFFSSNQRTILQCTSKYPVDYKEVGLNVISELKNKYPEDRVGLSDHSGDIFAALAAMSLGAQCVELHLTHHKGAFGPDVSSSLDPEQFSLVCDGAEKIATMLGANVVKNDVKKASDKMRNIFMKSIYLRQDLNKGERITEDKIKYLKPMKGIPASEYLDVIGKTIKHTKLADEPLFWKDLDD